MNSQLLYNDKKYTLNGVTADTYLVLNTGQRIKLDQSLEDINEWPDQTVLFFEFSAIESNASTTEAATILSTFDPMTLEIEIGTKKYTFNVQSVSPNTLFWVTNYRGLWKFYSNHKPIIESILLPELSF